MAYDLIITDVDGCLTSEGSVPFDPEALSRLGHLMREASDGRGALPPMTLCTGRPQPYVEALMKMLGIRLPAICENGAVIYTLDDNRARFGPGVTEEKVLGLRTVRAFIETELLPQYPQAVMQFGKEAQLSVFSRQPEVLPELGPPIEDFLAREGGPELDISPSHYYLNLSLRGVNKGRAIEWLLGELGLCQENVAGIGDTEGDLPIRQSVGWFACPSNATADIQRVADFVASRPEAEGVLEILDQPQLKLP